MLDSCVSHDPVQSAVQKILVNLTETACAVMAAHYDSSCLCREPLSPASWEPVLSSH